MEPPHRRNSASAGLTSPTVVHGDALEWLDTLPDACAQLIVADPPYYQVQQAAEWDTLWPDPASYLAWSAVWMAKATRLLNPSGLLYVFGQPGKREHVFLHLMSQAVRDLFLFHDLIIWDRAVGYNERRDSFTPAYEMILVLKVADPVFFDKDAVREPYDEATRVRYLRDKRYKDPEARIRHLDAGKFATNLWRIPSLKGTSLEKVGHPTQKPLALIDRIVLSSSRRGDWVIDPFCGSGTTGVAALRHGRCFAGCERDATYAALARSRMASADAPTLL